MELYKKNPKKFFLILIIALSLFTHFAYFGHPKESVFDEVHFGRFVSNYPEHTYYFDIHPPLGKLMLVGFSELFGYKPMLRYNVIGTKFTGDSYLFLRFLPTLAGSLLPVVIFLIAVELDIGLVASFLGALLLVFENAGIVQSRLILLDSLLLIFGFSSILAYLIYRRTKSINYFLLSAFFAGCSMSIKWTGASFISIPIFYEIIDLFHRHKFIFDKKVALKCLSFVVIPLTVYYLVFAVHFALLTKTGKGDNFMSPKFQSTLVGNPYYGASDIKGSNTYQKFIDLNKAMYKYNTEPNYTHIYSSKWYTWPFMTRPIFYWENLELTQGIYLLGNPAVWYLSTVSLLIGIVAVVGRRIKLTKQLSVLYLGYLANMIPFMRIDRIMFLYHYLAALVFSVLIFSYVISNLKFKYKNQIMIIIAAVVFVVYLFFAPLTYGLTLSKSQFNHRMWLSSWH